MPEIAFLGDQQAAVLRDDETGAEPPQDLGDHRARAARAEAGHKPYRWSVAEGQPRLALHPMALLLVVGNEQQRYFLAFLAQQALGRPPHGLQMTQVLHGRNDRTVAASRPRPDED